MEPKKEKQCEWVKWLKLPKNYATKSTRCMDIRKG